LAGVNKVALGFDRISFDLGGDDLIRELGIINAGIISLDIYLSPLKVRK
jgi:hypothetical protein